MPRRWAIYLDLVQLSQITRQRLLGLPWEQDLDESTLDRLLTAHLPSVGEQQRKWIVDALAVAAYHAQTEWPIVRLLICDDAPQFSWVTADLALCWVHEGRHDKKLTPWIVAHRAVLDAFLTQFWDFYADLLAYRDHPTPEERVRLTAAFDTLFATTTD